MKFRTPAFWYAHTLRAQVIACLLSPLSLLYYLGHRWHQASGQPYQAAIPVWCVGNLVAGGSGKTPVALALMTLVQEQKIASNPCFLSRGYGSATRGPLLIDRAQHDAATVGDEPLLLARIAPTIVSTDRAAGARAAEQAGFDLIIMDDGLQNRSLARDRNFLCFDIASGFGNGHLLPAGPLRQTIKAGTQNIDAVILIGKVEAPFLPQTDKPIFRAVLTPVGAPDLSTNYFAFTGLARPEKFRRTLEELGVKLVGWKTFPDHYQYTAHDLQLLRQAAGNATLLTTEKDAVRLPKNMPVEILRVKLDWQNPTELINFLQSP